MAFWSILRTLLLGYCTFVSSYKVCDLCDCTVSENPAVERAIINYIPICNEGSFRWYVHDGALGLTFKPSFRNEFQLCFVLQVENVRVQVSEERAKTSLSSNEGPSTLRPVLSADSRTKETCILSSDTTVKLFLEPERTVNSVGFGFVDLQFIMEKRNNDLLFSSMEECRPCTEKELINAYCTHDIVLIGSMNNVTHNEEISNINIQISKAVRQRRLLSYQQHKGNGPYKTEAMTVHRRCNIGHDPELFLFTGKWRLGQLKLTCSPYFKDLNSVLKQALLSGRTNCPV